MPILGNNLWIISSTAENDAMTNIVSEWWISRGSDCIEIQDMSQTCEEFVVHEDRVLSSIYSSRAGHGERTRCAFITNTSLEVMCAQYMLSAFVYKLATMIAPFTEMIDVVKMDGHSFTLTTGGLQEIVELLQTSGLTSINDAYRIVVSAFFKAGKPPDVDPFDNLSDILEITSSANPKKKEDIK